jgi:hypothetical protein
MKIYFKNDTPFLPIERSEQQAKQQFYVDLINQFNINEFVKYEHSEVYFNILGVSIALHDIVQGLSHEHQHNLATLLASQYAHSILESKFNTIQPNQDLYVNMIAGMNDYSNIRYHVMESESKPTHNDIRTYLKSKF